MITRLFRHDKGQHRGCTSDVFDQFGISRSPILSFETVNEKFEQTLALNLK